VEELAASERALGLVRDQFETNYFGPVNLIKSALPALRKQSAGHILVLSGISKALNLLLQVISTNMPKAAHIGTPGLGVYCASEWALEGFCDVCSFFSCGKILPNNQPTEHCL
jgi:NAD(P)-dependent dehydrogenase (short-subunit alcohol dehydrogenase family)